MPSSNLAIVQGLYAAFAAGDIPTVLAGLSPDIVWNEAENYLYANGNPYQGPDAVLNGVFAPLAVEWNDMAAVPQSFHNAGDTVFVVGRYTGVYKATGRRLDPQFVHMLTLQGGKVVRFQQYTDTLQTARVGTLGGSLAAHERRGFVRNRQIPEIVVSARFEH